VSKSGVSSTSAVDTLSMAEEGGNGIKSLFDEESSLQPDLQRLIGRLQDLISGRLTSAAGNSPQQLAAVKRYREILLDLRSDYDKSLQAVRRSKERYELLSDANIGSQSSQKDQAMEHLLRERNHIANSMNAAQQVIGQADAVRSDLYSQGRSLRGTGALMQQLTTNIPGLNTLVDQIRRRRSRDDKIVASVIASCVVFTLWYLFG